MIFVKLNADGMLQSDERKMESHLLANILDHGHLVTQGLQVSSQIDIRQISSSSLKIPV